MSEAANVWDPPLPPDVRDRLRDLIGLLDPVQADPFHVRLVNTVYRTRTALPGAQMVALRFDFNWELNEAGRVFARAKTDYEHFVASEKARLLLTDTKMSVAKAEVLVEGDERAYDLLVSYRLAEQRERSMRKFLDTLENQVDVWRTVRADERKVDGLIAGGHGGQS